MANIPVTHAGQEEEAVKVGKLDAALAFLFSTGSVIVLDLLGWALTALPFLDTWQDGQYRWATVPLGIILGAIIKGYDRKKHEDPSKSTGLIEVELK